MWITETIFVGSDGNRTIEINESTTEEWAEKKRAQQIERWYKLLVDGTLGIEREHQLDLIQFTLSVKNKNLNPKVANTFNISVYEGIGPVTLSKEYQSVSAQKVGLSIERKVPFPEGGIPLNFGEK
jgi:methyl coenzyme M reductase gamma subunit